MIEKYKPQSVTYTEQAIKMVIDSGKAALHYFISCSVQNGKFHGARSSHMKM